VLLMWLCAKTQEFVGDDVEYRSKRGGITKSSEFRHYVCARVDTTMLELSLSLKPQTLRAEQRC